MYHTIILLSWFFLNLLIIFPANAQSEPQKEIECSIENRLCILQQMKTDAALIDNVSWRDQAYRELAKTFAFEGKTDEAITLIDSIETPDTKAMTIRGIGMAVADHKLTKEKFDPVFKKLRNVADKIEHQPSYGIALTYIAMAQAFAGDHDGAWKTASEMQNEDLRHKAFAETAEIQAERGDFISAQKSIGFIESLSFRNKAYLTVIKILADQKDLVHAYELAKLITNPYTKTEAVQYILDIQKPREIPHQ